MFLGKIGIIIFVRRLGDGFVGKGGLVRLEGIYDLKLMLFYRRVKDFLGEIIFFCVGFFYSF